MRPPASALASHVRPGARAAVLTSVAMLAFASNSLLCRLALQAGRIDAASFGTVRLVSGALMLALVARAGRGGPPSRRTGLRRRCCSRMSHASRSRT